MKHETFRGKLEKFIKYAENYKILLGGIKI